MASKRKKAGERQGLSLDGVIGANHSYRPGQQNRPRLGEYNSLEEGFHSQRPEAKLDQPLGTATLNLSGPSLGDNELHHTEAMQDINQNNHPKPPKNRFRRLTRFFRSHRSGASLSRRRKIMRILAAIIILGAILAGFYFGYKFWQTAHNVFKGGGQSAGLQECHDTSLLNKEGDCRINILLLGIGGPGHDGPDLTDTILLASIDPINNTAALLSIPRDLWVQIPGYGNQKINAAYAWGKMYSKSNNPTQQKRDGLKLLDQTLGPVIGMNINYHMVVDFKAFKEAVNDLGGVTINVTQNEVNAPGELYDPTIAWENNNNPVIARTGTQKMDGQQALLFARSRETSSDFSRSQRQRALLMTIGQKALNLGTVSNPIKISKLLNSFGSNVFTDLPLSAADPLYKLASRIPSRDITSLDLAASPGNLVTTANVGGASVVTPVAGFFDYSQIIDFVRPSMRDGLLAKENATVAIYNATDTPGLATEQASILKSYGYRINTVGTAANQLGPANTQVVDLSGGKDPYTNHYLGKRFNAVSTSSLPDRFGIKPPAGTDFVIILGQDASVSTTTSTTAG